MPVPQGTISTSTGPAEAVEAAPVVEEVLEEAEEDATVQGE